MQFSKFFGIFITFIVLIGFSFASAFAEVIISEVYPAPGVGESEWIEVFNTGEEVVDLTGWTLFDQLSSPSLLYTFPLETSINSLTYLWIELPSAKLNNSGDGVDLFDAVGELVDSVSYTSAQSQLSLQRQSLASNTLVIADPTPGAANASYPLDGSTPVPTPTPTPTPTIISSPTPTPTTQTTVIDPSQINLLEINACPLEGKESITLFNSGSALYLDSWLVIDAAGNQKAISGVLSGQERTVFEWSGSLLNNSGDSLQLVTQTGQLITTAEYDECIKGTPLVLSGGSWLPSSSAVVSTTIDDDDAASVSAKTTATANPANAILGANTDDSLAVSSSVSDQVPTFQPLGTRASQIRLSPAPTSAPTSTPTSTPTPNPSTDPASPSSSIPLWPGVSVIMGGLLQLIPSSFLLYDQIKLVRPPPRIFA